MTRQLVEPASPCVSICALDTHDICIGCLRTGQEIANWGAMSASEKVSVLRKVAQRETASAFSSSIRVS